MRLIDLNCDLGEYEKLEQGAADAQIMPFISSCNIACGGHAGNALVINQTIENAIENQVSIGAHPSYPDRAHFGRQAMNTSDSDLKRSLKQQILTVKAAVERKQERLHHVKPHGALYNQAANKYSLALLIAETVAEIDLDLKLFGLAHSHVESVAEKVGLSFVAEGFVDRAYTADRTLVPRDQFGACLENPIDQIEQVINLLSHDQVNTITGEMITVQVDTLCLHGDHPHAIQTAKQISLAISKAGFQIQAP